MSLMVGRERLEVRFRKDASTVWSVGTLARIDGQMYFEYEASWLGKKLELSPFHLPLLPAPQQHRQLAFGPLFGLFDDSLPDGWGRLLTDRFFRREGVAPERIGPLDRLAFLGERTMGALTYHPSVEESTEPLEQLDLARLASEAAEVLQGTEAEVLPQLLRAGGSPGGARPKVLVGYNSADGKLISGERNLPEGCEPWLVKFYGEGDSSGSGVLELAFAEMAKRAGLSMPETRLFETDCGRRFFGVKRFDRGPGSQRFHVHTFGNLIQANFRIPCCDYEALLKASLLLTRDRRALFGAFRQAVFNVAAHNRDDHAKNFAFLLDAETGIWGLAPSYDLTFSTGPGGEHTTTVCGEGANPGRVHLLELASRFDIDKGEARAIMDEVETAVASWAELAKAAGVGTADARRVGRELGIK